MKYVILSIVVIISLFFFLTRDSQTEEVVKKWCYYYEYDSYDSFEQTVKPQHTLIKFNGKKVKVFVLCDTI